MSAAPSIPESSATLEAAQAGLLYERYSSKILGYCRRRLPSREEAEDAVQHTFLNAYRSLRTGVVPHAEAAWLYKIAENVCHERRRSAWRRSRIEIVSDDGELREAVAAPAGEHDELAGLADALAELTPNQRRAILLREWQGLSYREIAEELETTEAAIETLLFRARRSLARKLDRSRGRVWGGLNLGSLVAYGKSLFGGAALKIAAATVVVAAGATLAAPSLRHHVVVGGSPAPAPKLALTSAPASLQAPAVSAAPSRTRPEASSARADKATGRTATPRGSAPAPKPSGGTLGNDPRACPGGSRPSGGFQAGSRHRSSSAAAAGAGRGAARAALPVQVPPVPPVVPPVTLPTLPSLPPLPGLPKLP